VHHVRELMDEVFGCKNFMAQIAFAKTSGYATNFLTGICDYILWYGKDRKVTKYHQLYADKIAGEAGAAKYNRIMLPDGNTRTLLPEERSGESPIPKGAKFWVDDNLTSQGNPLISFKYKGVNYSGTYKTTVGGLEKLARANRLYAAEGTLRYIRFIDDFPAVAYNAAWMDIGGVQSRSDPKIYVVQTSTEAIKRCLLMTTDPGDLVFDPTCGSGTTEYVAEQWGRRWITCDTSRVALTLAKQRLMTAVFDYYELAHPEEGVGSGFRYKTVPHVTLKSIANNEPPATETLYDQPFVDRQVNRVAGPFTVEAVPAPTVKSIEEALTPTLTQRERERSADASIARQGETLRQAEWRDEMLKTGIRGKAGQHIRFARLEPLPGCRWLHADGETRPSAEGADAVREEGSAYAPQRIVVSFGPEHAPLEKRQVELALQEAQTLVPKPKLLVFTAFQFDPEAAKDIDETKWPGVTLLKAKMNDDLLTEDLKKKRASNESFWLIGQPDVQVERLTEGVDKDKYRVSVHGFDYYNTKTGNLESGGADKIAVWLLDTDYDGRSLFPRQVFFPLAGPDEGWAKLARNLKAEIDPDLIEAYRGTVSLPFEPGKHRRIAVKIVDDRGIESLKVMEVE